MKNTQNTVHGFKVFNPDWTCSPNGNTKQYFSSNVPELEPIRYKLPPWELFHCRRQKIKEKLRKSNKKSGIRFQTLFSFILILSI